MFLASAKKVIILISERVGDAVFCTPAIAYLKKMRPDINITLLALSKLSAEVYENNPAVKEILIKPTLKIFLQRRDEWDALIDLHNSMKTLEYVMCWYKTAYLSPRGLEKFHQSWVALNFVQSLVGGELGDFYRGYSLYPMQQHDQEAQALLKAHGVDLETLSKSPLIGCHLGCYKLDQRLKASFFRKAKLSNKTWPYENFAHFQKKLYEKYPQARLLLTGSKTEEKLLRYFDKNIPNVINLYGKTSVLTLTALMKYLNVFFTGDTGPLHLAASTDVPIVSMYFGSNPDQTGPYPLRKNHHVLHDINSHTITPDMVLDYLGEYLSHVK